MDRVEYMSFYIYALLPDLDVDFFCFMRQADGARRKNSLEPHFFNFPGFDPVKEK